VIICGGQQLNPWSGGDCVDGIWGALVAVAYNPRRWVLVRFSFFR
jgi:hypothetical protein